MKSPEPIGRALREYRVAEAAFQRAAANLRAATNLEIENAMTDRPMLEAAGQYSQAMHRVVEICATYYHVPRHFVTGERKFREYIVPRQIAMVLCHSLTDATLVQVGRFFGKDHGTIIHAEHAVRDRVSIDQAFAATFHQIANLCRAELGIGQPKDASAVNSSSPPKHG